MTAQGFARWRTALSGVSLPATLFFALALAAPAAAQTSGGFKIVPIPRPDNILYVSFDLEDGFTDDVRAAIQSGLKTTFTYDVELRLDVPGWVDRTIGTSSVTASVEYNNLLRRYTLTRVVDGKQDEQKQVESEAQVRQWLTHFSQLPLFRTYQLEGNRDYYVRVRATARPGNGSMLWPFGAATSAMAKFTFIK